MSGNSLRGLPSRSTTRTMKGDRSHYSPERHSASILARSASGLCTVYGHDGSVCILWAGHTCRHELRLPARFVKWSAVA